MHPANSYGSDLLTVHVRKADSIKDSASAGFEDRLYQAKCLLDGDKTASNSYFCLSDGERTLLRKAFDCIDVLNMAKGCTGEISNFGIKDVLFNVWRLDRTVSSVAPSQRKNRPLALDPLSRGFLRDELKKIFNCGVDLTNSSSDEDFEETTLQPAKPNGEIQFDLIRLESSLIPSYCQVYEPLKTHMKLHHAAKAITLLQSEACVMICVINNPGHFYVMALDWKAVVQLAAQETAQEVEALFRYDGLFDGGKVLYKQTTQLDPRHQITQIILVPLSHVKTDLDDEKLGADVASLALQWNGELEYYLAIPPAGYESQTVMSCAYDSWLVARMLGQWICPDTCWLPASLSLAAFQLVTSFNSDYNTLKNTWLAWCRMAIHSAATIHRCCGYWNRNWRGDNTNQLEFCAVDYFMANFEDLRWRQPQLSGVHDLSQIFATDWPVNLYNVSEGQVTLNDDARPKTEAVKVEAAPDEVAQQADGGSDDQQANGGPQKVPKATDVGDADSADLSQDRPEDGEDDKGSKAAIQTEKDIREQARQKVTHTLGHDKSSTQEARTSRATEKENERRSMQEQLEETTRKALSGQLELSEEQFLTSRTKSCGTPEDATKDIEQSEKNAAAIMARLMWICDMSYNLAGFKYVCVFGATALKHGSHGLKNKALYEKDPIIQRPYATIVPYIKDFGRMLHVVAYQNSYKDEKQPISVIYPYMKVYKMEPCMEGMELGAIIDTYPAFLKQNCFVLAIFQTTNKLDTVPVLDSPVLPVTLLFAQYYDYDKDSEPDDEEKSPLVELFTLRLDEAATLYFLDVENLGQIYPNHPVEKQFRLRSTLIASFKSAKDKKFKVEGPNWQQRAEHGGCSAPAGPLRKENYGPLSELDDAPDNWSAIDEAITSPKTPKRSRPKTPVKERPPVTDKAALKKLRSSDGKAEKETDTKKPDAKKPKPSSKLLPCRFCDRECAIGGPMTRHEKSHIEAGDIQDAVRVANRAECEDMHQTEVQENYPAYTNTDGEIYVCNAADLKELPKNVPPGTSAGQRDAEDMPHSYAPTKSRRRKRVTIDERIDSSSSHHGDRSKHQTVPVILYHLFLSR